MSINTVWSIDVGKSSLKAIKIHREQSSLEIIAVDKIDFEATDSGIDSMGQAKNAMRTFAARNTIDCPVAVVHPSRSAFSRFINLPPVDSKELDKMIEYEAQQQIPFPIDEVIWDYHISEDEGTAAQKEIGIFAVRQEAISDFILDYQEFPLELISVGYIGLLNYVTFDLRPNRPVVVLDMGSDHTDLLIVDGQKFWFRSLPSAGKDFTQALQEKFKLEYSQAEELKTEGGKSEHAAKIFQVVQPLIKDLINEINRSIGFYKSQAGEVKFEDLFLFGNGSKLLGLKNFLQEHLKFRVHVAKGFHRLRVNRDANVALLQRDFPAFASCVGAGIQALGEGDCDVNLLPQEQQEALEFKKKQKTVLIAAASLYLLIGWLYVNFNNKITGAESVLKDTEIAKELGSWERDITRETGQTQEDLRQRQIDLTGPVEARLAAYDAWITVQDVFSEIDNAATAADGTAISDQDESGQRSSLESEQESVNERKWWLSLVEINRVLVDRNLRVTERDSKNEELLLLPTYQVTLNGIRYRFASMVENTEKTRAEVVQKIHEVLQARYGGEYPLDQIQLEISDESPPTIFTQSSTLGNKPRGGKKEDRVTDQGTLFEFTVSWLQPLPEFPAEPGTDDDE